MAEAESQPGLRASEGFILSADYPKEIYFYPTTHYAPWREARCCFPCRHDRNIPSLLIRSMPQEPKVALSVISGRIYKYKTDKSEEPGW